MKAQLVIAGILAAALHAFALFGLHPDTPARPLPTAPESLEVELTSAPEEPAAPPELPPEPEPEPPPEPMPEPLSEPEPVAPPPPVEIPVPEISKLPEPEKPRLTSPKPKAPAPKPKPAAPVARTTAPSNGAPSGPAKKAGPTTGVRVRSNPSPAYPAAARQARQEGTVTVDVEVSAAGLPVNVGLARSSGFPALDQAALAAVRRWRFEPARTAGMAVSGRVRVPVRFRLDR